MKAEDPEVEPLIRRCVCEKKTLIATYNEDALKLADVVVVDVQCDYLKESLGDLKTGRADMAALEKSMYTIAERVPAGALTLIETTVAPRHDGVRGLPDHEEGLRASRHRHRSPAGPQLRARDARAQLRGIHPRLLARVQRRDRGGQGARGEVPLRGAQHQGFPADGARPPARERDGQDRGEQLPRYHPGVPRRVERLRRAQRRGPDQGHQRHQGAPHAQQHDLPRPGHRRLLPAQGRRAGHVGLQAHPRL